LNLRDSGCTVRIGLRAESQSRGPAEEAGFDVLRIGEACAWADLVAIMLPDQYHRVVYESSIKRELVRGDALLFAHGFSIRYGQVNPPADVDVVLVAPVSPGHTLRRLFREGQGVPGVVATHQDVTGRAGEVALSYAKALGCTRTGVIRSTFQEETETDLFGEQAVLCGGIPDLMKAGFDTLVEAGYQPELAFFECVHQVKLIVDLIYEGGFAYLYSRISDTAEFGAYRSGPRVVSESTRDAMREVLADITGGKFAADWINDYEAGMPSLRVARQEQARQTVERVGSRLRNQMHLGDEPS
jgi:ketol-acid reductoisomerase